MFPLAEVALWQYALVGVVAFCAAIVGGVAGYGTGLLLPPVLLPIIGAEAVVPVIGLSALMVNGSRLAAYRPYFERRMAMLVALCALPGCALGAYGYTSLAGPSVMLVIGTFMVVMVPARRILKRLHGHIGRNGVIASASVYGVLVGGTTGTGVILLSILLAAGLTGTAVIATDAAISIVVGVMKVAVFQANGALPLSSWIMALLIGVCASPGAFVARRFVKGVTDRRHVDILDAVVVLGGALLLTQGIRAIW